MDIPSLKWRRISPGWYQAELQSPTGTTKLSIERQTRFKIHHCRIDYPDGTRWTSDRDSLDKAKFACEWQLNEDVESKLGWKKSDYTEMIQRVTIHPGSEASVGPVVDALKGLGFAESEIRVLRLGEGDSIDRILAYRDDSVDGPPGRLDFERSSDLFEEIWSRVGYVRIQLDLFRKGGETISGPSLFEWIDDRKTDG
ncbi:hypothetical protein [Tautonia plasticadhaerens]|uniref:Uncharacterized protein n=1 Tax=Tautonia plasticadhaerens TaxID=2527974 RepID=A0A518H7W4_9BACT|nr:hypothetical protein [Tautonia plasticadhaerens]QDV36959.1 hypothetical protein ElP_48900 [Tautonia plasticadhaerens]